MTENEVNTIKEQPTTIDKPKKSKTKIIFIIFGGLIGLCMLCFLFGLALEGLEAVGLRATRTPTFTPTITLTPTTTPTITSTPEPTPTITPEPTDTPVPTDTPIPTLTPTPVPEPIVLSGTGDSVVDFEKDNNPAILKVKHEGTSNFSIVNYGVDGERYSLLVNKIGEYEGTLLLDVLDNEHTGRFEITARAGSWEIVILPLTPEYVELITVPGTYENCGDDVFFIIGDVRPDTATIDHDGSSNFVVRALDTRRRLLVNEIGSYHGTVLLQPDTFSIEVFADGCWAIQVNP
jgi:hypothetical protein